MQPSQNTGFRAILRVTGALWFAAVLLIVLILAMACATVAESAAGPEWAMVSFYRAWWFRGLMALLAINVVAAVLAHYPFSRRQVGFVITHVSIVAVLGGALVTHFYGVEGQLGFAEGETVDMFAVPEETLTMVDLTTGATSTVALEPHLGRGLEAVEWSAGPRLTLGDAGIVIDRYLPDSMFEERVGLAADGMPHVGPAISVSLSSSGNDDPQWLFLDRPVRLGPAKAQYRLLDAENFVRLATTEMPSLAPSVGTVHVEYQERPYDIKVEDCLDAPAAVGDTGIRLRVLRYLPHATVTEDNQVANVSPDPINPAIEVGVTSGDAVYTYMAFARYPDFRSKNASEPMPDLKVTFDVPAPLPPQAPIEVFAAPDGTLYARFAWEGTRPVTTQIEPGVPIETPWPGKRFSVIRRIDRAQVERELVEVRPVRDERVPAVAIRPATGGGAEPLWVQRRMPAEIMIGQKPFRLMFGDTIVPLGFEVTLNQFRVRHYPGTQRPRSFESRITLVDRTTGESQTRVVSMNNPASFGVYSLYQASYLFEGGLSVSFLNVGRDPGQPIVFAGYIGTMIGMLMVLLTRLGDRRRAGAVPVPVSVESTEKAAQVR